MALTLDKQLAVEILREEAAIAQHDPGPAEWVERVERLSQVCESVGARTHIAVLGIMILAKATDVRVDPFALKPTAGTPGAFSARSFGHAALVPYAPELGIDLGVRGREPLNNLTFIRAQRIDSHMTVLETARPALTVLLDVLSDLSRVGTEAQARSALRAFIHVRRQYRPQYGEADHGPLGLTYMEFAERIAAFVAADSEGGRRAQALTAGLLAMRFGDDRVLSKGVNDPDRRLPGDVGVLNSTDTALFDMVFEVRDKPVSVSDVRVFAEKAIAAKISRAGLVAVSGIPDAATLREQIAYAAQRGVALTVFPSWAVLLRDLLVWSNRPLAEAIDAAHRAVDKQLRSIEASAVAVQRWAEIGEG